MFQILICRGRGGETLATFLGKKVAPKTFQINKLRFVAIKTIYTVMILNETQLLSCCKLHFKPKQQGLGSLRVGICRKFGCYYSNKQKFQCRIFQSPQSLSGVSLVRFFSTQKRNEHPPPDKHQFKVSKFIRSDTP